MKNVKTAILLTALLAPILAFSFPPSWADTYDLIKPKRDPDGLPDRQIVFIQNPGIWQHVVARHTVHMKSRVQKQGLEMVRILKFRLPEPITEEQKDKITNLYVIEKDGQVIGRYEFEVGDQEFTLNISAVINYIQVYVECASHGLWRRDVQFA